MNASDERAAFVAGLGFQLDPFQIRALDALDAGSSVVVAAPTGSGKTVVAEYAVAQALAGGGKAFYTTPLKALSNQKFGDLVRRHGAERVGLLTGDNAINPDAPVVVMTTEVLRNMIYARSSALDGLRSVVLDEVHYLENAWRGPVWEEVIIHTPPAVDLVCLSATVSNAEEFAEWVSTVRGAAIAIIEECRPVDLHHLYLLGDRGSDAPMLLPTFVDGRPNPEASEIDGRSNRAGAAHRRGRTRYYTPRRADVIELLASQGMLPAIYFIFSRAACDDAVRFCLADGLRLTTAAERDRIREIAEAKVDALGDDDLRVLRYGEWLTGLEAGVAAHHSGMVPPFKEAVELCFAAGLIKAVFATETLALGINMPARTVVVEKLTKFTGERHEFLKPGEYTQLTGRAGRRGLDDVGYAVVLWSPWVPFDQVAGLASKRSYALSSSFRPTYNMAANLVRRYDPEQAHHLLNLSFAQFQADRDIVNLETKLHRAERQAEEARAGVACDAGDIDEYRLLAAVTMSGASAFAAVRGHVEASLERLRPGDVVLMPGQPAGARAAVVSTARRRAGEIRVAVIGLDARRHMLAARDFGAPVRAVGRVTLPEPYEPRSKAFAKRTVAVLRDLKIRPDAAAAAQRRPSGEEGRPSRGEGRVRPPLPLERHPCSACPDLAGHLRAEERAERLEAHARQIAREIRGRSESLARQFDRVLRVLEAWGYVDGWALTDAGERLASLYHESDLLVAEALRSGVFDGLDPAAVAGLVSTFTYEARGATEQTSTAWFPSRRVRERWHVIEQLAAELNRVERDAGLTQTRTPDPGFVPLAYAWAAGEPLDEVLSEEEMSGGDFVRNIKQLIDLLRQIAQLAPEAPTREAARRAAEGVFRGVVAASAVVRPVEGAHE